MLCKNLLATLCFFLSLHKLSVTGKLNLKSRNNSTDQITSNSYIILYISGLVRLVDKEQFFLAITDFCVAR